MLKAEKSSDSTPRSSEKELPESNNKKSIFEMEKTIFTLKRIIEKLQAENKRLKFNSKKTHLLVNKVNCTIPSLILYIIFLFFNIIYVIKYREKQILLKEIPYSKDNMKNLRSV